MARTSNKHALPDFSSKEGDTETSAGYNNNDNNSKPPTSTSTGYSIQRPSLIPTSSNHTDALKQLKRKFLLQNKLLASRNEELSMRVTVLTNELLSFKRENLELRNREATMRQSLSLYSMKFENQVIAKFEQIMSEFNDYRTSLGVDINSETEKYGVYVPSCLKQRRIIPRSKSQLDENYFELLNMELHDQQQMRRKSVLTTKFRKPDEEDQKKFENDLYMNQNMEIRDLVIPEVDEDEESESNELKQQVPQQSVPEHKTKVAQEVLDNPNDSYTETSMDLTQDNMTEKDLVTSSDKIHEISEKHSPAKNTELSSIRAVEGMVNSPALDMNIVDKSEPSKSKQTASTSTSASSSSSLGSNPLKLVFTSLTNLLPTTSSSSSPDTHSDQTSSPHKTQPTSTESTYQSQEATDAGDSVIILDNKKLDSKSDANTKDVKKSLDINNVKNVTKKSGAKKANSDTKTKKAKNFSVEKKKPAMVVMSSIEPESDKEDQNPFVDETFNSQSSRRQSLRSVIENQLTDNTTAPSSRNRRSSWLEPDPLAMATTTALKRKRKSISYQLPPLNKKMRRKSDRLVDAVPAIGENFDITQDNHNISPESSPTPKKPARRRALPNISKSTKSSRSKKTTSKKKTIKRKNVLKPVNPSKLNSSKKIALSNGKEDEVPSSLFDFEFELENQENIRTRRMSVKDTLKKNSRRRSIEL
ncbi:unnamed protein product [Ambrosiozyma monospora]|uniref:Unnamed protein product n=1 Tax=Ambrosiozyma monospora TaxID=43982 RepID=A0A9W6Z1E4_AMBMO|nr:unnamed protein product [Ambrosiozyma monospora]